MCYSHNHVLWTISADKTCRYPVLSATDKQTSKVLLIAVIALHTGLALAIKILFFA